MDINKYINEIYQNQVEYLGTYKPVNNAVPLVTVIVTAYKHVSFIKQCLDGILMQNVNFPFEILVGEDESNDGTQEICKEYAEKHQDKIRLFLRNRKESIVHDEKGRLIILNSKLLKKISRGKYTAICEGDDYWLSPNKLQKQVDFLEANLDFGLVHTDIEYVNEFSNIIHVPKGLHEGIRDRVFDGYLFDYYLNNAGFILSASCLYRSELLKNPGVNEWFVYDHWNFMEIARKSKVFFIPEKLTAYRRNPNSLMMSELSYVTSRYCYVLLDQIYRYHQKDSHTHSYYSNNKKTKENILKCYILLTKMSIKGKLKDRKKMLSILAKNLDYIIKLPFYASKFSILKLLGEKLKTAKLK